MTFKKTYTPAEGYTPLCCEGKTSFRDLEFGIIRLNAGGLLHFSTGEKETAFVILGGTAEFSYGDERVTLGTRTTVFSGDAEALYLPRNSDVDIRSLWQVKIAVCRAPIDEDTAPAVVRSGDIKRLKLGQLNWTRETTFIIDERVSKHLFVGEAYPVPGNWAGFPPHKHDADNMPFEDIQEELYYFLFQPEQGFALSALYTGDGSIDECYKVNNDELVEFPRGYHTTVSAPGYNTYFLWVSSVRYPGMYRSSDPAHAWISAAENLINKNL